VNDRIFIHDSSWLTAGQGVRNNNPCNVRPMGKNTPYPYVTVKDTYTIGSYMSRFPDQRTGIFACVELYARKYAGKSADAITYQWAGNPESDGYWTAIRSCYNTK
jgi:hypothetical protein